jgi:hypothetical protein
METQLLIEGLELCTPFSFCQQGFTPVQLKLCSSTCSEFQQEVL